MVPSAFVLCIVLAAAAEMFFLFCIPTICEEGRRINEEPSVVEVVTGLRKRFWILYSMAVDFVVFSFFPVFPAIETNIVTIKFKPIIGTTKFFHYDQHQKLIDSPD